MDKEKRREQSKQMKKEHRDRNLLGISMLHLLRWRGTFFVHGQAQHKRAGNIFTHKKHHYK